MGPGQESADNYHSHLHRQPHDIWGFSGERHGKNIGYGPRFSLRYDPTVCLN